MHGVTARTSTEEDPQQPSSLSLALRSEARYIRWIQWPVRRKVYTMAMRRTRTPLLRNATRGGLSWTRLRSGHSYVLGTARSLTTARCSTFLFAPLLLAAFNPTSCLCSFLRSHVLRLRWFFWKEKSNLRRARRASRSSQP